MFASLPQVERGVSKIIGGDPKGNNFLYTNGKCVVIRNIDVMYPDVFILSLCVPPREVTPLLPSTPSFPRLPVFPSRRGAALEVTAQRSARGTGRCVTQAEAAGSGCRNSWGVAVKRAALALSLHGVWRGEADSSARPCAFSEIGLSGVGRCLPNKWRLPYLLHWGLWLVRAAWEYLQIHESPAASFPNVPGITAVVRHLILC